jgi:aspartate-semialdehyde dehydrogenase
MINETKKILNDSKLNVSATCVRVPILNSHAVSVYLELENDINLDLIKKELAKSSSIVIMDDLGLCPSSIIANGNDLVFIGRIRIDLDNPKGLWFYCVSDNLRKGAASNAIQILRNIILDQ